MGIHLPVAVQVQGSSNGLQTASTDQSSHSQKLQMQNVRAATIHMLDFTPGLPLPYAHIWIIVVCILGVMPRCLSAANSLVSTVQFDSLPLLSLVQLIT